MEVKLHKHEAKDQRGNTIVVGGETNPQYRVYVDGIGCGYVGSRPNSPVLLTTTQFSDSELEEIRGKVEELRGASVPVIKQPPKVDPELLKAKHDGIEADDLD